MATLKFFSKFNALITLQKLIDTESSDMNEEISSHQTQQKYLTMHVMTTESVY